MDLSSNVQNGALVVAVNETRIDSAGVIEFKDRMRKATEDASGRIILDLEQVDFIDSSGLGAIVASLKLLGRDRQLELAGLTENVDKVFRLTRMDKVFKIHPSVVDAVA